MDRDLWHRLRAVLAVTSARHASSWLRAKSMLRRQLCRKEWRGNKGKERKGKEMEKRGLLKKEGKRHEE